MEEEQSSRNYFLIIMIFLFIVFLILYISGEAGYYEYKVHTKTTLTEEAVKKFEKDIAEGKNVKSQLVHDILFACYTSKNVLKNKTS